jgi:hypothetical protein
MISQYYFGPPPPVLIDCILDEIFIIKTVEMIVRNVYLSGDSKLYNFNYFNIVIKHLILELIPYFKIFTGYKLVYFLLKVS